MSTKPAIKFDTYRSWAVTKFEVLDADNFWVLTDSLSVKTGPINEDN